MGLIIFKLLWIIAVSSALAGRPAIEEFVSKPLLSEAHELTGAQLVDYVNKRQPFFKAKLSPLSSAEHKARLMHPKYLTKSNFNATEMKIDDFNDEIPERFDARLQWLHCQSIRNIRDQSHCGSCWAVSAAETMSDRACIQSKGRIQAEISDTDILACCGDACGEGCEGGIPLAAWQYFVQNGVCTGGDYGEKNVCKPYAFHPCGFHRDEIYYGQCPQQMFPTPPCKRTCQAGYHNSYESDKIYGKSAYRVPNDELAIQKEILRNGPVQAAFLVYEDFSHYHSGIYVHIGGRPQGGHAVKVIGWGVEDGIKYWIVANSWNTDWGENGFFRIVRGVNHCGIEEMVVAGMVDV